MRRESDGFEAAFGVADAGGDAPEGVGRWARAVDLGARGDVAAARGAVETLLRTVGDDRTRALAYAARASWTRQSGRHGDARVDDGRAARLVARSATTGDRWAVAAWADALTGLAADSLGIGDFSGARRLLHRVDSVLPDAGVGAPDWVTGDRLRLRLAWVQTELALYSGDTPGTTAPRERAVALAADCPSPRHVVKTDLIAAAVAAAVGDIAHAAELAGEVEKRCATAGLLPLSWAASTMLAGCGPEPTKSAQRAAAAARELAVRGMPIKPAA
ncbi:hypothetical protein [Gordonia humi]|uniref:Uncharacterized protein n=1 Tax=Gordonia humi TaxID=686429 RepID=A0A840F0R5_9ACTN|nr:hypothetical protein [Gordonia humi]MBB4135576.1 hypothetical protein [Gordonia humi]